MENDFFEFEIVERGGRPIRFTNVRGEFISLSSTLEWLAIDVGNASLILSIYNDVIRSEHRTGPITMGTRTWPWKVYKETFVKQPRGTRSSFLERIMQIPPTERKHILEKVLNGGAK
jgi:hypothetical protein